MHEYYVYRYQYHDMKNPRWGVVNAKFGVDSVSCCMLAKPGLLTIKAANKREALKLAKENCLYDNNFYNDQLGKKETRP